MTATARPVPEEGRPQLEGAFNLRDFGGYATSDGRHVRRGVLYRSGTMALLTEADADHLRALGIRAICDFRRANERAAEPTAWHGAEVDYFCRDYGESSGILSELMRRDDVAPEDMRHAMISTYRAIPVDHAESYRAMFRQIASGRVPILINCSAGKDRTGVGAALILTALGVPRDTIVQDYLLTNSLADWDWLLAQRNTLVARSRVALGAAIEPLLRVDTDYLDAMFHTLDESHGGIEGYLRDALGVDETVRETLRRTLVD
ncbi:tyrosine-protein phosphatase [Sphingobium mellinum]|uniref:tyrosine-protein phosphatase n=1 Tax=Sphingobium mellinum TaxID=1387166 RepID=UPI0030EB6BE0